MGNKLPNSNLFREGTSIGNIAGKKCQRLSPQEKKQISDKKKEN